MMRASYSWALGAIILFQVSLLTVILVSELPEADGASVTVVQKSKSCELSDCISYCDILHLDNSTQWVAGQLNQTDGCYRGEPYYDEYWRLYTYLSKPIVELDSNYPTARYPQTIMIQPGYSNQTVIYNHNTTAWNLHEVNFASKHCYVITSNNIVEDIANAIRYALSGCDSDYLIESITHIRQTPEFREPLSPAVAFQRCIEIGVNYTACNEYLK